MSSSFARRFLRANWSVPRVLALLSACMPAAAMAQQAPRDTAALGVAAGRPALKVLSVTQSLPGDVDVVMQFDRRPFPLARQLQLRLASGATVAADRVEELPSSGALMVCIYNGRSVTSNTLRLVRTALSGALVPPAGYSRLGAQVWLGDAEGKDVLGGFSDNSAVPAALARIQSTDARSPLGCASASLKRSLGMMFTSRTLLMLVSWNSPMDAGERDALLAAMKATPDLTVTVVNISSSPPAGVSDGLSALYAFGKATPTSTYINPQGEEGLRAVLRDQVARASPGPSVRAHFTYSAVDDPGKASTAIVKFQDAPDSGLSAQLPVPLLSSK